MADSYDRDETFGYGQYEGMLVGKDAALADWRFKKENEEFERLCATLRAKKWAKENLERARELRRKNGKKPATMAYRATWKREKRLKAHRALPPIACLHCAAAFCVIRPMVRRRPVYCSPSCVLAARRQRRPKATCPCGAPMTGRRERCRKCAQLARREREASRG